jgi:hypothetical protein
MKDARFAPQHFFAKKRGALFQTTLRITWLRFACNAPLLPAFPCYQGSYDLTQQNATCPLGFSRSFIMLRRAIIGAAMMKKLSELTVLTRGGRGVASGIAHKLHRSHFRVCLATLEARK